MNRIFIFLTFIITSCNSQNLVSKRDEINKAKVNLQNEIENFSKNIVKTDINICTEKLIQSANNEYEKYVVAGILYNINPKQSYKLHEEAYLTNTNEQNFILEYALELHRNGKYSDASKLYETYSEKLPNDIRTYVWLSDCYINLNEIEKAILNWDKANHIENHIKIDNAIHTIYGRTDQINFRNELKLGIEKGNLSNFYSLLFLDKNWESDWWNKNTQEYFLNEDLEYLKSKLKISESDYKILNAYIEIKKFEENNQTSDIKNVLIQNEIILNNKPIPTNGQIASDILRICFYNKIIDENDFYAKRGTELLELSKLKKDKELLNIYAYLQANIDGKVNPEIDKLGWKDFKDERFAKSYFILKSKKMKSDDIELNQAINDFPNSSYLFWVKTKCIKMENKPVKEYLVELVKKEFKTLDSDESRFSYRLNSYIKTLSIEK